MWKTPKFIPIRVLNVRTGEVVDFWGRCSVCKAKNIAKSYDKRTKFTDLKVYRNVKNPLYS